MKIDNGSIETASYNNTYEGNLLDEFVVHKPKRPAVVVTLLLIFTFYILFILADLTFDLRHLSLQRKEINWPFLLIILTLPVLGFILFVKGYKLGWIISLFYYIVIGVLIAAVVYREGYNKLDITSSWRQAILIFVPALSVLLLLQESIRSFFRITKLLFLITLLTSIAVAVVCICY